MRFAILTAALLAGWAGMGHGAGLRDLQDSWLLPTAVAGTLLKPPGSGPGAGWWLAAGDGRLYGLAELPQRRISAGGCVPGTRSRLAWSAARETLGETLVQERRTECRLVLGDSRRAAIVWTRAVLAIDGDPESSHDGWTVELGHDWRGAGGIWSLDLCLPLDDGPPWYGSFGRRRFLRAVAVREASRLAVSVAVDRRGDGSFAGGVELDVAFGSRLALGVRTDPTTGEAGPVTLWRTGALLVRTCHVAHPELGTTHRCELVFGHPGRSGP